MRNKTIHYNLHKLGFRFLEENYQVLSFLAVAVRFVKNCLVHGDFENIFTFETYQGSHASNQKEKSRIRPRGGRTLDMQHNQNKPNRS